jgi:two-component system nitrogen regulation response regulator GlnG
VARALHDFGKRKRGPFVAINMAAIPKDLIESELFGHEKGAFTGAAQRSSGRFEQAEGGTLFLDEIGDMPMEAQTRLLRVLQQGEYTMVGGRTPIRTDVRIVAATNKDLRQLIEQGLFREDLYYRLNVVPIRLPPLRERVERRARPRPPFPARCARKERPAAQVLPARRAGRLAELSWPGNIRELENLVRRLVALYPDENITREAVEANWPRPSARTPSPAVAAGCRGARCPVYTTMAPAAAGCPALRGTGSFGRAASGRIFPGFGDDLPPPGLYDRILRDVERPLVAAALAATRGNQVKAADLLGLNRNTLRKKIKDLNLKMVSMAR